MRVIEKIGIEQSEKSANPQRHDVFCSFQALVRLEKMRSTNSISNWYQVQRNLFTLFICEYILSNLSTACAA